MGVDNERRHDYTEKKPTDVIICSWSLLLLVPLEDCSSWLWHFLGIYTHFFVISGSVWGFLVINLCKIDKTKSFYLNKLRWSIALSKHLVTVVCWKYQTRHTWFSDSLYQGLRRAYSIATRRPMHKLPTTPFSSKLRRIAPVQICRKILPTMDFDDVSFALTCNNNLSNLSQARHNTAFNHWRVYDVVY